MRSLRPTGKLLWLLAPGVALAGMAGWVSALLAAAVVWNALVLVAFALDARAAGRSGPRVVRGVPKSVMRGKTFSIAFTIENRSGREQAIVLHDRLPADVEPREVRVAERLPAGATVIRTAAARCLRRGHHPLSPATITWTGPLGLAAFTSTRDAGGAAALSVIADLSALGRFEALRRHRRLHEMGITTARVRGQGTEIEALRPYALGDPYAAISWKATARRGRPVVRETRAERRQNVLLVLDCGRRMAREVDGRSRLDHAVEAALLLGDVAIRSDDRVGLVAFADRVVTAVTPQAGTAQLHRLATATHALEPTLREPPYLAITGGILTRFPRRALTVLFTDATEPSSVESLAGCIKHLSTRHLVLVVLFKDEYVERARREPIAEMADLFRVGAAADLAVERTKALEVLRRSGALVIEAAAETLSSSVVNRYLEVKGAHLI